MIPRGRSIPTPRCPTKAGFEPRTIARFLSRWWRRCSNRADPCKPFLRCPIFNWRLKIPVRSTRFHRRNTMAPWRRSPALAACSSSARARNSKRCAIWRASSLAWLGKASSTASGGPWRNFWARSCGAACNRSALSYSRCCSPWAIRTNRNGSRTHLRC